MSRVSSKFEVSTAFREKRFLADCTSTGPY